MVAASEQHAGEMSVRVEAENFGSDHERVEDGELLAGTGVGDEHEF
jgi:hypothetical protein